MKINLLFYRHPKCQALIDKFLVEICNYIPLKFKANKHKRYCTYNN